MVTAEDKAAVRTWQEEAHWGWVEMVDLMGQLNLYSDLSCMTLIMKALEKVVKLVAERGLPLNSNVCRFWNFHFQYDAIGRNRHVRANQKDVQPLWAWLLEQRRELGTPFVRTMLERFGAAVGARGGYFLEPEKEEGGEEGQEGESGSEGGEGVEGEEDEWGGEWDESEEEEGDDEGDEWAEEEWEEGEGGDGEGGEEL